MRSTQGTRWFREWESSVRMRAGSGWGRASAGAEPRNGTCAPSEERGLARRLEPEVRAHGGQDLSVEAVEAEVVDLQQRERGVGRGLVVDTAAAHLHPGAQALEQA